MEREPRVNQRMVVEYRDPATLTPHPQNYRGHPAEQVAELAKSVRQRGQYKNIVINSDDQILAGEGVWRGCVECGQPEVAVVVFDGTEEEQKRLMVADNELSRLADDDEHALHALLDEIERDFGDLRGTGWDDKEHEARLAELAAEALEDQAPVEDPGAGEAPEEPQTKLGDVWLCGAGHRVVCGDCTSVEVVDAATAGKRVTAILTDPPYQMAKDIANDNLGDDDFAQLHRDFIAILPAAEQCTFVSFHSPRTFPVLLDAAREAGWKFERMLWMYKPNDCTFPWRGWIMSSEVVCLFSQGGGAWTDLHPYAHDCYEVPHTKENLTETDAKHPSVKKTEIITDLLSRIGDGGMVFDGFAGSGTTLIAAETAGRACAACELEPRYVDVAVRRWAQATGQVPVLEADGTEFEV